MKSIAGIVLLTASLQPCLLQGQEAIQQPGMGGNRHRIQSGSPAVISQPGLHREIASANRPFTKSTDEIAWQTETTESKTRNSYLTKEDDSGLRWRVASNKLTTNRAAVLSDSRNTSTEWKSPAQRSEVALAAQSVEFAPSKTVQTQETKQARRLPKAQANHSQKTIRQPSGQGPRVKMPALTASFSRQVPGTASARSPERQVSSPKPKEVKPKELVRPLSSPPGWIAVGTKLTEHLTRCEALLKRRANYSAREEAELALHYLCHVLDGLNNGYTSQPAVQDAMTALFEAEDFENKNRVRNRESLSALVLSHKTPILKNADRAQLAPMTAAQHYRAFAQIKLVEAAQDHPWCSEILYSLGRCYQAEAESDTKKQQSLLRRATVMYRAALEIAPKNTLAANQLGYILLLMDQPQVAKPILVQSINAAPSLPAVQNLAEAAHRLNDQDTLAWANGYLQQNNTGPQSAVPPVLEVEPTTFMAISPYGSGPQSR